MNREFYTQFGDSFSVTRHRIQPGVRRVMGTLKEDESILDLGCGNGEFARELARGGHRGPYLGVDFSLPLLRDAEDVREHLRRVAAQAPGLAGLAHEQGELGGGVGAVAVLRRADAEQRHFESVDVDDGAAAVPDRAAGVIGAELGNPARGAGLRRDEDLALPLQMLADPAGQRMKILIAKRHETRF